MCLKLRHEAKVLQLEERQGSLVEDKLSLQVLGEEGAAHPQGLLLSDRVPLSLDLFSWSLSL